MKLLLLSLPVALLVSACAYDEGPGYGGPGYDGRSTVVVEGGDHGDWDREHRDRGYDGYGGGDQYSRNENDINVNRTNITERNVNRTNVTDRNISRTNVQQTNARRRTVTAQGKGNSDTAGDSKKHHHDQ